jgi:hypothetical protein
MLSPNLIYKIINQNIFHNFRKYLHKQIYTLNDLYIFLLIPKAIYISLLNYMNYLLIIFYHLHKLNYFN